jgi:hypothetical protein
MLGDIAVKSILAVVMVCVMLLNSGCAIFDAELHNRGGYLDRLADDHWFKADSKRMRALRAFAIQASLARIASVSPKNDQDRTMMAIRIGNATARAKYVIECGFTKNPVTGNEVSGDPCFFFDSLMVDYTTALFDLAMVAFPVEDTKNLINVVVGGFTGPLGALDALNGLLNLAKEALKYGRVVGGIYRDTVELEVQIWISSADAPQVNVPPKYRVTPTAVAALREAYARGNDDMPTWLAHIAALRKAELEPVPDPRFIDQLSTLMTYLCGLIVNTNNPAHATCVGTPVVATTATTPMVAPAPAPVKQSKAMSSTNRSFVWRTGPLAPQAARQGAGSQRALTGRVADASEN